MKDLELKQIGIDDFNRPVYKDNDDKLWKDVNCDGLHIALYSACNNEFDGEPDMPIRQTYIIK